MTWRSWTFALRLSAGLSFGVALAVLPACRRGGGSDSQSLTSSSGLRPPPGGKAGGMDAAALASLHGITTTHAPAAVRPDPDLYVRRLLRQYRSDSAVIARQIGRVEEYRLLLGGASEDFRTIPQESYDATSLLAMQTVAEELCEGLVAPKGWEHPGWKSILPRPVSDVAGNVRFLAQRFIGVPTNRIGADVLTELESFVRDAAVNGAITADSYVPACIALSTDAEALLL